MAAVRSLVWQMKILPRVPNGLFLKYSRINAAGYKSLVSPRVLPSITTSHNISQKAFEEEESKQIRWVDWLVEPFVKSMFPKEKVTTQEEIDQRQELLSRIQACYYKKPPEQPGNELFVEAFHLLIKYDDWRGVETLWKLGQQQQQEFDEELIVKIENYLLDVRQRSWFE